MKYYGELTQKLYDTERECAQAEEAQKKAEDEKLQERKRKNAKRTEDAKMVEAARKDMLEAQKVYKETLEAFVKEYGSYHFSTSSIEDFPHLFMNLLNF